MVFKNLCILVLWMNVASAVEGLNSLIFSTTKQPDDLCNIFFKVNIVKVVPDVGIQIQAGLIYFLTLLMLRLVSSKAQGRKDF